MYQRFTNSGYDSQYFVRNAGTLFLFFIIVLSLFILLLVLIPCVDCHICCYKFQKRYKRWIMFNPLIRLLLEAALDFSFSVFIQQRLQSDGIGTDDSKLFFSKINGVLVWTFLIIFCTMPLAIVVFLFINFK